MGTLERIEKMKQGGLSDTEIFNNLKDEGISPRELNEALSQYKIKSAITPATEEMQPSVMTSQNQFQSAPEQSQTPEYTQYSSQEQYQDPSQYQYTQGYSQSLDPESIRDIAKREVEESASKIKEQLTSLSKENSNLSMNMQSMEKRMTRVEEIIQELQSAIIRKMGEYGEAISGISDEIKATQDSFSKIINPVLDKKRGYIEENEKAGTKEKTEQKSNESEEKSKSRKRDEAGFERFLR